MFTFFATLIPERPLNQGVASHSRNRE